MGEIQIGVRFNLLYVNILLDFYTEFLPSGRGYSELVFFNQYEQYQVKIVSDLPQKHIWNNHYSC